MIKIHEIAKDVESNGYIAKITYIDTHGYEMHLAPYKYPFVENALNDLLKMLANESIDLHKKVASLEDKLKAITPKNTKKWYQFWK